MRHYQTFLALRSGCTFEPSACWAVEDGAGEMLPQGDNMPIDLKENELLLRCACGASDHIAFLIHEPDDSRGNNLKGEQDDWYLTVRLDHFRFWRRLRLAFRYVFAPHTIQYGTTAELVLRSEDVDRICKFIVARRSRSIEQTS